MALREALYVDSDPILHTPHHCSFMPPQLRGPVAIMWLVYMATLLVGHCVFDSIVRLFLHL